MKAKFLKLLALTTMLVWCASSRAQIGSEIIYSNAFSPSLPNAGNSIEYSPPTYITPTNLLGASATATWALSATNINPAGNPGAVSIYQSGYIGTNVGTAMLPLSVQTNAVYIIYCSLTTPSSMPTWVGPGFTTANCSASPYFQTNYGLARFNDNPPNGYDWMTLQAGSKPAFYAGSKTSLGQTLNTSLGGGTHTIEMVLVTLLNTNLPAITSFTGHGETNDWVMACFVDGSRQGTTNVYLSVATPTGPPPLALNFCALGQNTWVGDNTGGVEWNYFTLSTPLAPLFFQEPTATNAVNQNANFSDSVWVLADTNGGPLVYQWYTNGVPLSNGGNLSGVTSNTLSITGVLPVDAGTNYYVVVTNTFGAVTSTPANLTVFGVPQFTSAFPMTYTNLGNTNQLFLYGGNATYYGSSPSFSVGAAGALPIAYYWFTNGVPVASLVNSTSFSVTNCQMNGPTTITCMASNSIGTATNIWAVTYLPAPTMPFQQAVLTAQPLGYWRMNDTNLDGVDDGNGDNGYICHDYESGNDGIFTNVILGVPSGYSPSDDPTETSAQFGILNGQLYSEDANSIGGTNIDFSTKTNGEFTISLWANGYAAQGAEPGNAGLFCKGYFSAEECCLDIDPHTYNVRFTLRNAAGTQINVVSSEYIGTDPNWHFITGVCDETNGLVSLYVDGALQGQTSIPPGSGIINSATTPIIIGARSSSATTYGDNQFEGNLNDVAVYGYAMSAGQIISQYQAAGYTVTPYVVLLSGPPTNFIYLPTTTVTLPATAYGTPPFGYYWTNTTAGGILGTGSSSVAGSLNATLTIPNISSGLSGDVLELVVTNASASTNVFVTLNAAPAPITLSYTSGILYSNSFNGGSYYSVNGTGLSAANVLVGGASTTWVTTLTNGLSSSSTINGNGTLATNAGEALVPFTPELGYIYTMTGSLIEPSSMGDFVHMGFCQDDTQTNNGGYARFNDAPIGGYDFLAIENASITFYAGKGAVNPIGAGTAPTAPVTNVMVITLNCVTNNGYVASASIDGVGIGTNYYSNNFPPIGFAGIGQQTSPGTPQWQSWTLTQFAPGGVPPYLLVTPSTSGILLTNQQINLNATAFGSAPMGYYWINNSSTVAAGITNTPNPVTPNNAAPFTANLSITNTSLSGGTLELVVTNAYGTNITSITLTSPFPSTGTNMTIAITNGTVYLSWPPAYTGAQLQALTNTVNVGVKTNVPVGNNWANFNPGGPSTATNKVNFPINQNNGTVFYRWIH